MATNPRIKPVERATNRSWGEWLRFVDGIGAKDLDHKAIALEVYAEHDGPERWTSTLSRFLERPASG